MSNFGEILTHLSELPPHDRGSVFELYCRWFLKNDPRYALQLKNVWLWNDWPKNWGRDKGIDLIAETHNGEFWAIQAKAYDEDHYISKDDIDSFLSESARKQISFRLLISTTNNLGHNAREVVKGQEKFIGLCLLNDLEAATLEWPASVDHLISYAPKAPKSPRPHQEEAINKIILGFENSDRGQLHMACGTGKTLVGLWTAKQLQSHHTLVLVPSISLVSQLFHEWAENSGPNFNFDPIFICSDQTVDQRDDEQDLIMAKSELGFPITTDAQELITQLSFGSRPKVIFSTYHSSPVIAQACAEDESLNFDLTIADEAHRCAGPAKSDFSLIVDKSAIRAKRRLFMTATPKIFADHVKQKTKDIDVEIVSMDDSEKFGPVFHTFSFSQAIKQDLLSDYQVVIAVMDNAMYREYAEKGRFVSVGNHETDARTLASQLLVAKAIKQYGLKRVISFHNRKKAAREFINTFPEALDLLTENEKPAIGFKDAIFGEMQQSERRKILKRFEQVSENSTGLLANVKCLSEGVDVPTIDGIAFIDPKGSEIDIVQSVGRVIRKAPDKKIGIIIIPVFVDNDSNETIDLEQSCFRVIWKVIKALRAHDDILAEELDTIRLELGKRVYKKPSKLSKIVIDVATKIQGDFAEIIEVKIIQSCSWVSLNDSHPEISKQWHPTKNGTLTPNQVTAGSHKRVFWKCSVADDHEWQASIGQRTRGNRCPMCRGSIIVASNCLATKYPALTNEWHPTKNLPLTPYQVHFGSKKKVYWKCPMANDHEWKSTIANRTANESGCPFCSGAKVTRSNCLATTHPEVALLWHPTKNKNVTAYDVSAGSGKKVWWKCPKSADHEWNAEVRSKVNGSSCSVCLNKIVVRSNCLATKYPTLSLEWHPIKNTITPYDVVPGSMKKVWWKCPKGHEWPTAICSRTQKKSGCPFCYKKNSLMNKIV